MRLIVKVLMIISLISSNFMSCKLYEKLLDKKEELLDNKGEYFKKKKLIVEPTDNVETDTSTYYVQDSDRGGLRTRSVIKGGKSEQKGDVLEKRIGKDINMKFSVDSGSNSSNNAPYKYYEQVANKVKEAENIKNKASFYIAGADGMAASLNKIKLELDEIKTKIDTAESDFHKARRKSGISESKKKLLPDLHKAIVKAKNSRDHADKVCYGDAVGVLKIVRDGFENAKRRAVDALEETQYNSSSMAYRDYSYFYWMEEAREAMNNAERMFNNARKYQEDLKAKMEQVNKEFAQLEEKLLNLGKT
ncbi:hypothetical protein [Borreliella bavariensis]|uniref:hypothetical protein n=1 Tax=Borreliella bavariensis TaxID=664662 RepID=UPI001BFFF452|nr:hypothetical protein [Borreliella bavariensis]